MRAVEEALDRDDDHRTAEDHLLEYVIDDVHHGERLDRTLSALVEEVSRGRVTQWIRQGCVEVIPRAGEYIKGAGHHDATTSKKPKGIKPSLKVQAGQRIRCILPPAPQVTLEPQDIPFETIYRDDDLAVIFKPPGVIVHPGAGQPDRTLVNGLLKRFGTLSPVGLPMRPGIVHRIDRDTSGLLAIALTERAHHPLSAQFAAHTVERRYLALVWRPPQSPRGTLSTHYGRHPNHRIKFSGQGRGGKRATTHWRVLEDFGPVGLLELKLETGRTHQIRVHMSEAGSPLLADGLYGVKRRLDTDPILKLLGWELGLKRHALHAQSLGFKHPITGQSLTFESPLPEDMAACLAALHSAREAYIASLSDH